MPPKALPTHGLAAQDRATQVDSDEERKRPVGLVDGLRVLVAPRGVFDRMEDTGNYGWMLITILVVVMLIGVAQVQTGLIDRQVEQQTNEQLAQLEKQQAELVDRIELQQRMEDVRENAEFLRLVWRIGVIGAAPAYFLASFLLIAAVLYAIVALTGRKPEYHTLMSICVFAAVIEVIGAGVRLAMMLYYRSMDVDTTLRPLGEGTSAALLGAIDPFWIWFWVLVVMGLVVTRQLGKKTAIASCLAMALVAGGVRVAMNMAATGGA